MRLELTEIEAQAVRAALWHYIGFDTAFFKSFGGGNSKVGLAAKSVLARMREETLNAKQ